MLDRTIDRDGNYGSLIARWLLMVLVYNAALSILLLPFVVADKIGLLPLKYVMSWLGVYPVAIASIILVGGVVIRLMHGTRAECGIVFLRDDAYIRYAVGIGAAIAVIRYASSMIPSVATGALQTYFHSFGHQKAFPMVMGSTVLPVLFGIAQAFLLFGVMQAYLSRNTSAHLRLGLWDIPLAGCMVLAVILIPDFITMARQIIAGYPFHAAATLVVVLCTGVATLASSYWFERSRSLTSPAIALGTTAGLAPIIHFAVYSWLR